MLRYPDPKVENEKLYQHAMAEINRLWDTDHTSGEFMYLLNWVLDYEDAHYPIDSPESRLEFQDGVLLVAGKSIDEPFKRTQFVVDVNDLVDFSIFPEVEDFSFRVVMNGYIGESGEKYYPARAIKFVNLLEETLEHRLENLIEVCNGSKD